MCITFVNDNKSKRAKPYKTPCNNQNKNGGIMNKSGVFIGGLIVGAAIGASLGVLYAPRSGRETRDQLKAKMTDLETELKNIKDKAKEKGLELKDEIRNKVTDLEKRLERLVAEYRKTVETETTV
jgi:gas vesicle protein